MRNSWTDYAAESRQNIVDGARATYLRPVSGGFTGLKYGIDMKRNDLPTNLHAEITRLCREGDDLVKKGNDQAAFGKYTEAWNLVPEDKANWEASTWILGAVGEIQFRHRKFDKALNSYLRAVQCPNGLGNPYIHLRIGEIRYELGDMDGAGDNLTRAYMGAGEALFKDEDPKYLEYLHTILLPPASGADRP